MEKQVGETLRIHLMHRNYTLICKGRTSKSLAETSHLFSSFSLGTRSIFLKGPNPENSEERIISFALKAIVCICLASTAVQISVPPPFLYSRPARKAQIPHVVLEARLLIFIFNLSTWSFYFQKKKSLPVCNPIDELFPRRRERDPFHKSGT